MTAPSSSAVILLLFLAAASVSARPCMTIFYFTYDYPQTNDQTYIPGNPNPNFRLQMRKPQFQPQFEHLTLVFTTASSSQLPQHLNFDPSFDPTSISRSVRDRSRDILSVIGALLFGVGCGTLTGATLYLVWALLFHRRVEFDDDDDDFCYSSEEDEEVVVARKLGYVAFPVPGDDGDDLRKPMLSDKEVRV